MRVTQQGLINNFIRNLGQTNSKLQMANNQISSGRRVDRPGDDAVSAAAITRLQSKINETVQFRENILQSLSKLNTVDTTLNDVSAVIQRTRELAVQAANGALSATERDAIAVEVNQLLESMVQIGNTTIGGQALFGGHESTGQPFTVVRGSDLGEVKDIVTLNGELRRDLNVNNITRVVFKGDDQNTKIEVDQNLGVEDNITGQDLFFYDDKINNESSVLNKKSIGITPKSLIDSLINQKGTNGISSGFVTIKNTRGIHLREDTRADALDNSTPLRLLNNRRGVGRDVEGNQFSLGHITITDSAGVAVNVNTATALPSIAGSTATLQNAVDMLNGATWEPVLRPAAPKVRFSIANDRIVVTDSAGGAGIARITDSDGTGGLNYSTTAQDLGLNTDLQPKTLDPAVTPIGLANSFGGVNFSSAASRVEGIFEFTTGERLEIANLANLESAMTYVDLAGNRSTINFDSLPGTATINDILTAVNTKMGTAFGYGNIKTAGAPPLSYFALPWADGTRDTFNFATLTAATPAVTVSTTVPSFNITNTVVPGIAGAANTVSDILNQVRNRLTRLEADGVFTVQQANGTLTDFNLSRTTLNQSSTLNQVLTALNTQSTALVGFNGFQLSADNQRIVPSALWPSTITTVYDQAGSTIAFDLGIDKPNLNAFPNLTQSNPDFPSISFDDRTQLSEWTGDFNITTATSAGSLRLQDSSGKETFVNVQSLRNDSTVRDLIQLINNSGSKIKAELSPQGQGIRFIDSAEGSGNFFVEDFSGSTLLSTLGVQTPPRGSKNSYDPGSQVLVDLTSIGSTTLTVGDMLKKINQQTAGIGVEARLDSATSALIFEDIRDPSSRGKFKVSVENAVGLGTSLEALNDGGGVNNYKIRITDSKGVAQVIDFQSAKTLEDVVNAINLSYEEVDEKTALGTMEGINFPLGTLRFTSSSTSGTVDLSALTPASSIRDLYETFRSNLGAFQMDVDLKVNRESRSISFGFTDLAQGDAGSISIQEVNGNTARDLKIGALAEKSPFSSGLLIHKRVSVRASLNEDRTGLKIVDDSGGRLSITEVEGRTTAHDLGLIPQGAEIGSARNGIIRGRDLNVFQKIGDELGVSHKMGRNLIRQEDGISTLANQGAIEDTYFAVASRPMKTKELATLSGSVDLDQTLLRTVPLSALNNATKNPLYLGNPVTGVDLSGALLIETLNDDGTNAAYQSILVDFNQLPDNPVWADVQKLIEEQARADSSFEAKIELAPTSDGRMKFISNVPVRISRDTGFQAANTAQNLFSANTTDFNYVHTTNFMSVQKPETGGISEENFFLSDVSNGHSLEIDLNRISRLEYDRRRELQTGDIEDYIEKYAGVPATLDLNKPLTDYGIDLPIFIPHDTADPVDVDSFDWINNLTSSTTVNQFLTAFNNPPNNSVFRTAPAGPMRVQLAIADGLGNSAPTDKDHKFVLLDQTGLVPPANLTVNRLPAEFNALFEQLGIQMGGQVSATGTTGVGIAGRQITGLGYPVKVDIMGDGRLKIASEGQKDSSGKTIEGSGRMKVIEGRGSTAADLKLIQGSGSIGDATRIIHSGDLNPGVERNTLLSEIQPKAAGKATNFAEQLRQIYIETGKENAFIKLTDQTPISLDTPFKAFNSGYFDQVSQIYRGGVDLGRGTSGFVIKDQYGREAVVDLSNNLSDIRAIAAPNVTAAASGTGTRFTAAAAGAFTGVKVDQFFDFTTDTANSSSVRTKYKVTNVDPAGNWIEVADGVAGFSVAANNYALRVFSDSDSLSSAMDQEYTSKPFYNENSNLRDLQAAINIAVDKAKRTTGFGVDNIELRTNSEGGYSLHINGSNGPTISIEERDIDRDGKAESSTAKDLGLLREVGARGNGSPIVTAGKLKIEPTISYILDTVNQDLASTGVSISLGRNASGSTLDITSNADSSYLKIRDNADGNTAGQLGLSSTRSIFQTLIDFRDSLFRDNPEYISSQILKQVGEDEQRILQFRAQIGSVVNRFETNRDRLDVTKIELTKRLSDNQDLNLSEAIIDLRQLENAQRAALNVGSRIIQQTLLDFLR